MNKVLILFSITLVAGAVFWLVTRDGERTQQKPYNIGEFSVTTDTEGGGSGVDGIRKCSYTVSYQNKKIPLGSYEQRGTCEMSQTPTLSNGMLAVITQVYVFLYDPKTDRKIMLDPRSITGFNSFMEEREIDIYSDFPQKRFIVSGDTLQIIYTRKPGDSRVPQMLQFVSQDNGKSFTFDPETQ